MLLENKANCKAKEKSGRHAAYWAAWYGYLDTLKLLVEKDGDVIDLKGQNGETPLIVASKWRRVDVCNFLVQEKNANVHLTDTFGVPALLHTEDPEIIEILRSKGAKREMKRK